MKGPTHERLCRWAPAFVLGRARWGGSGALLPAIRSSGIEFPSEARFANTAAGPEGAEGRIPRNVRLLNSVRTGR